MQIQNQNVQQENERLFTDYLARQPLTNARDFTFDIDNYRSQYPQAAQQLIKDPSRFYVMIKKYLQKQLQDQNLKGKTDNKVDRFDIKIEGNLGANFVTPRGLSSRMANQLVGLQGIITKMDITQHYLEKSIQYCPKTKSIEQREYPDSFNPEKDNDLNKGRTIRSYDDNSNPLQFEYGLSSFKNTQIVVIQELPEMAPPGLLPMSVQVVLQSHLVNSVKPGDRVQMVGIYKLITGMMSKQKGIFRPYFICLSIKSLNAVSLESSKNVKTDFHKQQIYNLFSRSVAPSIWGHEYLKKAVLLMLVGGVEKNLENGTHLRGDINLLMIGDPGTAKSQMLRWVLSTVDVSVGTTGSGASGVGLTAAIVSDKITGEKTLEAGAMVLADRGVVCIDEFDKMNQTDRVAVHEVMQQQTVTIAKAGLHCSLNARCSVIAAANPIYGQYQTNMPPTRNIGMPDSLLSRFDLIFIILDEKSAQRDKQIAEKVCRNHRLAPQFNDFLNQYMDADDYVVNPIQERKIDDGVYEKNNVYRGEGKDEILTQSTLKRYINFVKLNIVPQLTDDAVELGAALWNLLRQKDMVEKESSNTRVLPVTIRTHESLIRLSTSHAKLLQSPYVEVSNVIEAFKLMVYCLYSGEDALMEDVNMILKELQIDYDLAQSYNQKPIHKPKIYQQKEEPKKKIQVEEIRSKVQKMNFREGQKQFDSVLKMHVAKQNLTFTKEQKPLVYKKLSEMMRKKKGNEKWLVVDELLMEIKSVVKTKEVLIAILEQLEEENKVGLENGKIFAI